MYEEGMTVGTNYPSQDQSHVGANFPWYQPPMWLTSVGGHEQQRICRKYYPQGCPQEVAESMAFANKHNLNPPSYLVQQGKVYGLWKGMSAPVMRYGTEVLGNRQKRGWLLIGGFVVVVLGLYLVASVASKKKIKFKAGNDDLNKTELKKATDGAGNEVTVYLVSGEHVRNGIDVDFTQGGHDLVYSYVPGNEVWMDRELNEFDRESTLLHELTEHGHMSGGMPYEEAHELANVAEREHRNKKDYSAPASDMVKELTPHVRAIIKAKNDNDAQAVKDADSAIYDVLHRHGFTMDHGTMPSAFTAEEKRRPQLLAKRISCAAQIIDRGNSKVQPQAVCRTSVK